MRTARTRTIQTCALLLLGVPFVPELASTRVFAQAQATTSLGGGADGVRVEDSWKPASKPLATRWAKVASPDNALPEYPRPQMVRAEWKNLNGLWDYALSDHAEPAPPIAYPNKILVPYPYESSLSGVGKPSPTKQQLWYRRTFTVPNAWRNQNILLHFGAVNWDSTVFVNGKSVGMHRGGYDGFTFDITAFLRPDDNEVVVSTWNPLFHDVPEAQALGKQRETPVSVLYTASTGIWQTVWLEPVASEHIARLKITPDVAADKLVVEVDSEGTESATARVTLRDKGREVAAVTGPANVSLELQLSNVRQWSPDNPYLYQVSANLTVRGKSRDKVEGYAAMRSIGLGKDDKGRTIIELNGKPYFGVGVLDQGYWPDGLYTAPTDEALRYDIEMAKRLGFNLLRKHAKVESDRWYYWADKLGVLVWQDMPQMFGDNLSNEAKQQFLAEWLRIVPEFYNHPSIVMWTLFNENWGQHDTESIALKTKEIDPTRLINAASGGVYYVHDGKRGRAREDLLPGIGDVIDQHEYPNPTHVKPDATRAAVTGEFGGITMAVDGHRWTERVFAYGSVLRGSWFLTSRYHDLLRQAWNLKEEFGTSAVVYTQLTDVEAEINGLLTYDRAVIKPDVSVVAAANSGEFPKMPPNPNLEILPTSEKAPQRWRYTEHEPAGLWFEDDFDDSSWKTGLGPINNGNNGTWMRQYFSVSANFPRSLSVLARVDQDTDVYINGTPVAALHGRPDGLYSLQIIKPEGVSKLRVGTNMIAVHAHPATTIGVVDIGITEDDK